MQAGDVVQAGVGDERCEARRRGNPLELGRLGHDVNWWREWEWKAGCVCAVVKNEETGMLEGGADVRRPGGVRGW